MPSDTNYIELCIGGCVNSCINCFTYLHDKYTDWRWTRDGEPVFSEIQISQPTESVDPVTKSIHTAVIDRNPTEVVKILKARPQSSSEVNSGGETALHLACKLGYLEIVEALLDNDCPCVTTSIGSPIHCVLQAVKTGYVSNEPVVRAIELLTIKGCDIDARDRGQKTALFLSAEQGNFSCMELLLNLGCSVNLEDSNGFSPLYMSVIRGDLDSVNLLISRLPKQSDIDNEDSAGRTPLIAALLTIINNLKYEKMPNDIYNLNSSASDDNMELNRYNRVAVFEALLRAGADPNARDSLDRSALVIAFIILELDNIHSATNTSSSTSDVQQFPSSLNALSKQDHSQQGASTLEAPCFQPKTELFIAIFFPQKTEKCPSTENIYNESVYTPLVRLLVLSGAKLPEGWERDHSKSPDWLRQLYNESQRAWLEQKVQKPLLLIHLSRLAIRAHLAKVQSLHKIHLLPMPEKLVNYVCVKYL